MAGTVSHVTDAVRSDTDDADLPSRAWGVGMATVVDVPDDGEAVISLLAGSPTVLDVWYPSLGVGPTDARVDALAAKLEATTSGSYGLSVEQAQPFFDGDLAGQVGFDEARRVHRVPVLTVLDPIDQPPLDTLDVYFRLHLLSHRHVRPNGIDLEGLFGLLNNVVWTSAGPCAVDGFEQTRARFRAAGRHVTVFGVDKFPRMVDYVVPSGVRIADADRVRLGAHLASGTTVMHEGYCNFNAGTLGTSMVEGRISAGVVVGEGSDIGGGASIQGTLSGGGKEIVSIGEGCLIGANGGVGISLGDRCVVEAGLYVTAGTRVTMPDGQVVKAGELSGRSDVLFWRNSTTGAVEARPQTADWGSLNADLHHND